MFVTELLEISWNGIYIENQTKTSINMQTEENEVKVRWKGIIMLCRQLDESDIHWWIKNLVYE